MNEKQIPRIAIIGQTGSGKSATLNALFCSGMPIASPYELSPNILNVLNGSIYVEELPRFGETIANQRDILEIYKRALNGVDVALWILDAQSRSFIFQQEIATLNISRSVFAVNKVDLVYPGNWNDSANFPSDEQVKTIQLIIESVHSKIREVVPSWHGNVIGYSAHRGYNLPLLLTEIIAAAPIEKQHLFSSLSSPVKNNSHSSVSKKSNGTYKPKTTKEKNIFLCHASEDKAKVRELYQALKNDGFAPWLDIEDLLPGQEWQLQIPQVVRDSDIVLVCLSQSAVNKAGYVQKEIRFALDIAEQQPEGKIFLIPLKLENCKVPERITKWQWVNYYEKDGYSKLIRALRFNDE